MVFQRSYTAKQLNRGEGMMFHPISGEALANLGFGRYGKQFYRRIPGAVYGWWTEDDTYMHLPCIGGYGRKDYQTGDRYPIQWLFDPFTGGHLS